MDERLSETRSTTEVEGTETGEYNDRYRLLQNFEMSGDHLLDARRFLEITDRSDRIGEITEVRNQRVQSMLTHRLLENLKAFYLDWFDPSNELNIDLGIEAVANQQPDLSENSRYLRLVGVPKEQQRIINLILASWPHSQEEEELDRQALVETVRGNIDHVRTLVKSVREEATQTFSESSVNNSPNNTIADRTSQLFNRVLEQAETVEESLSACGDIVTKLLDARVENDASNTSNELLDLINPHLAGLQLQLLTTLDSLRKNLANRY